MPFFRDSDDEFFEEHPFDEYAGGEERLVEVTGVYEDRAGRTFVVLKDALGRQLPIMIGPFEAIAISLALQPGQITFPRPLTHDLLKNMLDKLNVSVEKVVVDDLFHDTFYARIYLVSQGELLQIDSRPSDAIALALRASAPIYVVERVFIEALKEETQ